MTPAFACDVLVIGAGSGGCVVAGRLAAESDAHVVLVEAGPDYGPRNSGRWPADLLDGGALVSSHDWGYSSGPLPRRREIGFPRARVIGGCSSHNGCVVAVGCPGDYDGWADRTRDDRWRAEAIRPALARALARLAVRSYAADEIGPFHRACLEAAAALGLPRADDLDELDGGVGFGAEPVNIADGIRMNAAFAYVDPVRERSNLTILDEAVCDRLVLAATGAEALLHRNGLPVRVAAGTVVLAAGSYGTPAILQRSGIGGHEDLERAGIAQVVDLPGVGRNLHDHPIVELEFSGSGRLRRQLAEASAVRFTPEEQTLGKLRSSRATGPYDLHLFPVAAPAHSLLEGRVLIVVAALEPRSRGRLAILGPDPEAHPAIEHGYLSDTAGHDRAVLAEGVERARELATTMPLSALLGHELTPSRGHSIEEFHAHYYHPVGTCAMGAADDPLAVCDGAGRVRGIEGVVVADCSLMPVVPRANTNVPAVLVGERIADALLGQQ